MHREGPLRLCAILMRNGLNGRSGTWSVVKADDGRWWRIRDMVKEEVSVPVAAGPSSRARGERNADAR